jgi:[ribosomal protein S5]-alanine N-acetyltransferase
MPSRLKRDGFFIVMNQLIFNTERLLFRMFHMEDAALIHHLNSDPLVLKYVHELPSTPERAFERLQNSILPHYRQYGYGRWAVELKATNDFIGWCGLKFRPERNETDLGYRFIPSYWGKGYAFEAANACLDYGFNHLQLNRITATAHVENIASLRIIEKCGMQYIRDEIVDHCPVKSFEKRRSFS